MFIFEYAIVSPTGQYYTGKAGNDFLSTRRCDAFTYTQAGAHAKIQRCQWLNGFTVKRVS
jgi:hypothetical protein